MFPNFHKARIALTIVCLAFAPLPCSAIEAIINGDFETGTLAGWSFAIQPGSNSMVVADNTGSTTPYGDPITPDMSGHGSFYAFLGGPGPGATVLYQTFFIPVTPTSAELDFSVFVDSYAPAANGGSLDYTGSPNQLGRIDILAGGSDPFSGAVIGTFFFGISAGPHPSSYVTFGTDLRFVITAPGQYILRFAEVNNQALLDMGIDNVSLFYEVPEGKTAFLAAMGAALAIAFLKTFSASRPVRRNRE
jgi:hypothetical protein